MNLYVLLLPGFFDLHSCPFPFSSVHLGSEISGPGCIPFRLSGFVQRRARRWCLRGTCMMFRTRQTTQVSGWRYHVHPKTKHLLLVFPRHMTAKTYHTCDVSRVNPFRRDTRIIRWKPPCERAVADYFVMRLVKGVAPPSDGSRESLPSEFVRENKGLLQSAGVKGASVWNTSQLDSYGYWLTFHRHLSLRRLRQEAGFSEKGKPEEGWWRAFELFRKAGMIP